jgi:exopolyphosphatase / guanosine-5'-triphosphate,3'-diphosphate pyrophosphatase
LTASLRKAAATARAARPGRVAIVDIGSNTVRLVVFDKRSRCPVPVFNEKAQPSLGLGLEKTGKLNPEGTETALVNIRRFVTMAEAMGVESVTLLATAAIRDAEDGAAFAAKIERATGRKVKIVAGEEEARLSALGVIAGIPEADGLMGDLGGGSLELVRLVDGRITDQATLPIGPLRLAEASDGDLDKAKRLIDEKLETLDWLDKIKGKTFYPVGGTWRSLARVHMDQTRYPLHVIHEYRMSRDEVDDLCGVLMNLSQRSLANIGGLSKRRASGLPLGALVLKRLLKFAKPDMALFSAYGLREGFLFSTLSDAAQDGDPLLVGCADLAGADGRFGSVSDQLDDWLAPLFQGEGKARARLREAACLLSDIAWREHADYRGEHAFLRVLRLPVAGITHPERVTLALSIAIRYGDDALEAGYVRPLTALLTPENAAFAQRVGTALRLAYALSGGTHDLLGLTSIRKSGKGLELVLPKKGEAMFGETIERRLDAVGRAFELPVAIV